MGFATSIAVIIFFVALLIVATINYPILLNSYKNLQDSKEIKNKIQTGRLNTAINITTVNNQSGTLNITAYNKGSTVLHANNSNVLIDGVYMTYSVAPNGLWLPGKNAVFSVNASGYRIKIITEKGISAYYNNS